jgi:hypothetical protein
MKRIHPCKYVILVGLLFNYPQVFLAQEDPPLCLAVSDQGITVVVLAAKINEVNLGSEEYVAKVNHNYLLLKSRKKDAAPTSLFVTYDDSQQFLHATLTYTIEPPKTYDLRGALSQGESLEEPPLAKPKPGEEKISSQVIQRIQSLELLPQAYKDLGIRRDGLTAIITHILADKDHYYLQLFIENSASVAFEVEEVTFDYVSGAQERLQAVPIYSPNEATVPARTCKTWVYVLASYALKDKDKLEINCWEKKGARHVQLAIPSSILLNSLYEGP